MEFFNASSRHRFFTNLGCNLNGQLDTTVEKCLSMQLVLSRTTETGPEAYLEPSRISTMERF